MTIAQMLYFGDFMKFNFKNDTLPFEGFDFGGRSYCKVVKDLDATKGRNGFGLIGDFVPKKEDIELEDGELYLSVSRGGETDVTHLFTIKDGKPSLIKMSKAQKGAIRTLWGAMEEFIAQRPKKSPQQLLNLLLEEEPNRDVLREVAMLIMGL